jgi:capsid protein
MATGEIFAITLYRRAFIVSTFCKAAYEAWLEEEIEAGTIPFPGGIEAFHQNRAAACRSLWRGTPKPQADDNKTAQAHKVWRDMGVMSDEMIANDLGVDIEDVYVQRAREAEMRKMYGLKDEQERQAEQMQQQADALADRNEERSDDDSN